jgi:glycerophosphoryl diester phosphodiesterase
MSVKLIAHRGYSDLHPENTLSAFKAAQEFGADAIELDVHLTRDGHLVVHHDYYLGNPDNGEGLIFEKDLAYLETLNIKPDEKIPTLEAVFKTIGDSMQYELELKGFTEEFLQKVVDLANKYGLAQSIEFTSPVPYVSSWLKDKYPTFKIGIFLAPYPEWMDDELGRTLAIHTGLLARADVLHCPQSIVDEKLIALAHNNGLKVHAADCNTKAEIEVMTAAGVDQLSTNKLELALAVRNDLTARSTK